MNKLIRQKEKHKSQIPTAYFKNTDATANINQQVWKYVGSGFLKFIFWISMSLVLESFARYIFK